MIAVAGRLTVSRILHKRALPIHPNFNEFNRWNVASIPEKKRRNAIALQRCLHRRTGETRPSSHLLQHARKCGYVSLSNDENL